MFRTLSQTVRSVRLLGAAILVAAVLVGCLPAPAPIPIAPADPVASLPALPAARSVAVRSYADALSRIAAIRSRVDEVGGQIDMGVNGEPLNCRAYFDLYQEIAALPTWEAAGDGELLAWAVDTYNEGLSTLLKGGRDVYNHCEAFLLGTATTDEVAPLSWSYARWSVAEGVAGLAAIAERLGAEMPATTTFVGLGGQILKATGEAIDIAGDLGYQIDKHLVTCPVFIERYEALAGLPTLTVGGADAVIQRAYGEYRGAVDGVMAGARDQYLDCQDFMAKGLESRPIPTLTWTVARKSIEDALGALHQVEAWLADYAK